MFDWIAYFKCRTCGEEWKEDEPPEGFMDIVMEEDRRAFVEEYLDTLKPHNCGILGGLADCTQLMRACGSFAWMNNEKEVADGLVGS